MTNADFPAGASLMAARMRAHDWSSAPLGTPEIWPQSLRNVLSVLLSSPLPTYLAWGPELTSFYNDAYLPLLGAKPDALGRPYNQGWPEAWDSIGAIERAMRGDASYFEDLPLTLLRNGYPEEAWFTVSYSPILDETDDVGGVLCIGIETTRGALTERRLRFLDDLGRRLRQLSNPHDILQAAAATLGVHFGAGRAGFAEIDATGEIYAVERDWTDGVMPSLAGEHRVKSFGGQILEELRAGRTIRLDDALSDPRTAREHVASAFGPINMASGIAASLTRGSRPVATIYVHAAEPRHWRDDEVTLIEEVAERVCEAVERARAETRLRHEEARLQTAADLVGLGWYFWTIGSNDLAWDDRTKALWGLSPDAPVDIEKALSAIHPEDRHRVEAVISAGAGGSTDGFKAEFRVIGIEDGVERWIVSHGRTFVAPGAPPGFLGAVLDTTERNKAEQELHLNRARLAAILDQLPVGVALVQQDGNIALSNACFQRYGIENLPSFDRESRWRAYTREGNLLDRSQYPGARALRGETVVPGIDFIFMTPEGDELWIRVSAAPFRLDGKGIVGAIAVIQDVDREKRAEEALRQSEQSFRQLSDLVPVITWFGGPDGKVRHLNNRWYEYSGQTREEALKNGGLEVVHPDDLDSNLAAWKEAQRAGHIYEHELRLRRHDGVYRWHLVRSHPLQEEKDRITCSSWNLIDS